MIAFIWLAAAAAQAGQAPHNPLNIPMPTAEELATCLPRGVSATMSVAQLSRAQIRAIVACANGLIARNINAIAPAAVDSMTTLVSAETSGATLQYNYRVDLDAREVADEQRRGIERSTRAYVCGQADMVRTMGNGGSYRYVWRDRAGAPLHQLLIEGC